MQSTLAALWGEVEDVKTRLDSGDELGERWGSIREKLGLVIREWERGKGAAARLSEPQIESVLPTHQDARQPVGVEESHSPSAAEHGDDELPEFMKSWISESDPGEQALVSMVSGPKGTYSTRSGGNDIDTPLPPPGIDEIFENDLATVPFRQTSTLSRDERIKLVREARANGLLGTVSDPIGKATEDTRRARMNGGDVVEELKGMIGLIRRKKGMGQEAQNGPPDGIESPGIHSEAEVAPAVTKAEEKMRASDTATAHPPLNHDEIPAHGVSSDEPKAEALAPSSSSVKRKPSLSNVLFPSEDMRKAFVFPALETRHVE